MPDVNNRLINENRRIFLETLTKKMSLFSYLNEHKIINGIVCIKITVHPVY